MRGKKIIFSISIVLFIALAIWFAFRKLKPGDESGGLIEQAKAANQFFEIPDLDPELDYGVIPDPRGGGYWYERKKGSNGWNPYTHDTQGSKSSKWKFNLDPTFIRLVSIAKERGYIF